MPSTKANKDYWKRQRDRGPGKEMKIQPTNLLEIKKQGFKRITKYSKVYNAIQNAKTPIKVICQDEKEMRSLGYSISHRFHRIPEFRKCKLAFSKAQNTIYITPIDLAKNETIK